MSNYELTPTEHLYAMLEYSENMIELWTNEQAQLMGELALRGEVECDFMGAEITE